MENLEFSFTYGSWSRGTQCFGHHSLGSLRIAIDKPVSPKRLMRTLTRCHSPTLQTVAASLETRTRLMDANVEVHGHVPLETPTSVNDAAIPLETPTRETDVELHHGSLSSFPSGDSENESLPNIIEPYSLDDLLHLNPFQQNQHLGETISNILDALVSTYLMPPKLKPSVDPRVMLSGLFAPVCETSPTICRISRGRLPQDLNGVYLRNGPNASLLHRGDGFHLFDGDGMIHSIMMRNGSASFCSRFVRTSRFEQEQARGRPLFPKFFGGMHGLSGVARSSIAILRAAFGLIDLTHGVGLSNTNVAFFNGHILSLSEEDMPYILKVTEDGDVLTSRQFKLPFKSNMCAHPKFDPITGEMYAFSLNVPLLPPFSIFRVSADGVKSPDITVPLLDIPLVHDFAITRRFIIFPDNQLAMRPAELAKGEMPLACDPNKTPRFCLLPRYGLPEESASKARWFDAPGVNCLHYLNAWDEGMDEVVMITSVLSPPESIIQIPAEATSSLTEIRFNTRTGSVKQRVICSGANLEFGVINRAYTGRKTRYAYMASGGYPYLEGVVKVDLLTHEEQGAIVGKRDFGEGKFGGEPFFVAARGSMSEDHGYVLCLVGDEKGGCSELLVMDALSPSLEVIAAIELPVRVPPGFHGCFVNEEQLSQQKP